MPDAGEKKSPAALSYFRFWKKYKADDSRDRGRTVAEFSADDFLIV
jgi:hypothetical protein